MTVDEVLDDLGRREGYTRRTTEHPGIRSGLTPEQRWIELNVWSAETGLSKTDLLNAMGRILAIEFHEGRATYAFCDMVVNDQFENMHDRRIESPKLMQEVFLAFDAGEIKGPDETTVPLIADIVKRVR